MENKTLILIAILFAIIGIVGAGIHYLKGITCEDCNFTGNTTFDEIKVNKISGNESNNIKLNITELILQNTLNSTIVSKNSNVRIFVEDDYDDNVRQIDFKVDYLTSHSIFAQNENGLQNVVSIDGNGGTSYAQEPNMFLFSNLTKTFLNISNGNIDTVDNGNSINIYSDTSNICYKLKVNDAGNIYTTTC